MLELGRSRVVVSMKVWTDVHIFNHPWEAMVEAAYRKYPNPYSLNVHSLDTLERRVTEPGRLFSHRHFCTMWSIPDIVLRILGSNPLMRIHEQSMCDIKAKTLTICARNLTVNSLFTLNETLVYSVNPDNPDTTVLKQTAEICVHGVPLIGDLLESILVGNYGPTVSTGRLGVETVVQKVEEEIQMGE